MFRVGKTVPPKRQILKDISLSFLPGAKIGILGLNGAGKSTVLRIMAGVDTDIDGDAIPMPNIIGMAPFQDGTPRTVAPSKGEHGVAILTEHGYSRAEIDRLIEGGILVTG